MAGMIARFSGYPVDDTFVRITGLFIVIFVVVYSGVLWVTRDDDDDECRPQ